MTRAVPVDVLQRLNECARSAERDTLSDMTMARIVATLRRCARPLVVVSAVYADDHVQAWLVTNDVDPVLPSIIGPLGIAWADWLGLPAIQECMCPPP